VSVELHHRLEGRQGPPVLVLAGSLGTTLEMWDEQVAALRERFRLLRYDMRGHGRSPVPPGPYTVDELGRDLLALLDRLGLERVDFCGVSLGGMVGMWLAAAAPERVERLALCCSAAHLPPREDWIERAETVRVNGVAAVAETVLARWFTPAFHERRPDVVARFRRALVDTPAEGYAGCCDAIAALDLRSHIASIRAPTLVIVADDDPATPPAQGRVIAESIEGARLVTVESARHLANVEQPDAVTRVLLEHLSREDGE
jgi:3-oxoadipate enol-lactonase